jgi:hypothetical protein
MADQALTVGLPYGLTPQPGSGMGGIDLGRYSAALDAAAPRPQAPAFQPFIPAATVAYSPSTNRLFVNGTTFDADNDTAVVESLKNMRPDGGRTPLPDGDWRPVSVSGYLSHAKSIADPTTWQLMKKNFGIGVDNLQLLGGYGLQFLGMEKVGRNVVEQQIQDLSRNQVYQREFTGIGDKKDYGMGVTSGDRGLFDWFAANLAQQGPNLIESIVTGAVGFLAGGAAGGGPNPVTATGGAIMALTGKETFKKGVMLAAQKHLRGEALDAAETKLLKEAAGITAAAAIKNPSASRALIPYDAVLAAQAKNQAERLAIQQEAAALRQAAENTLSQYYRRAGQIGGATLATTGQNIATGISDIYGETLESGDGEGDRLMAVALGIPYGLAESAAEFLAASRIFGVGGTPQWMARGALGDIKTLGGKSLEVGRRLATGTAVGGLAEGATEAFQESLGIYANKDVNIDSPEGRRRLLNAFAAGFGVGGPIGGLSNLRDNKLAVNLLDSGKDPSPPTTGGAVVPTSPPPTPPAAPMQGGAFTREFPALPPPPPPMLGGPVSPVSPVGGPTMMVTPQGVAYPDQMLRQQGNVPPGATQGSQGVLDVFGGSISAQELASRMGGQVRYQSVKDLQIGLLNEDPEAIAYARQLGIIPNAQPLGSPTSDPRQGALQFAPPAPQAPFNNQMAGQLQQLQDQQARQAAFQQAEAAAAAQREAEIARLAQAAQNQRQLDLAFPQESTPQTPSLPMTAPRERTPQQLPLFRPRDLPRPSRAEGLRRGVGTQLPEPVAPVTPVTPADLRRMGQMALFTQKGEPTVAALKSAGTRQQVVPTTQQGTTQIPPTGAPVTANTIAAARAAQNMRGLKRGKKQEVKPAEGSFDFLIANIKRPNGAIGTQGVTESQVFDILTNVAGMKNIDEYMTMREMVDAFKADPEAQQRLRDFTAQNPIVVTALPDGSFYINDGHHRAFLLDQIGDTTVRTVYKGEETNAVQERKPTPLDARKRTRDGEKVGEGDTGQPKTAGKGQALKAKKQEDKQEAVRKDVVKAGKEQEIVPAPKAATLKKGKVEKKAEPKKAEPEPVTAEEQWEDKKPDNAPTFDKLNPVHQQSWRNLVTRGKATMAEANLLTESYIDEQKEEGLLKGEITPLSVVNDEINNVEEATTIRGKADALTTVVRYAYFSPEETNLAEAVARARDYLSSKNWSSTERALIKQIVLNEVNTLQTIEAVYTRGENKGMEKPWFKFAQENELLPQIKTRLTGISVNDAQLYLDGGQLRPDNFPKDTLKKLKRGGTEAKDNGANDFTKRNPATKLFDEIQRLNSNRMAYTTKQQQDAINALKKLYADVQAAELEDWETPGGNPISAYFDDGTPKTRVVNGKLRVYVREVSDTEVRNFEAEDRGEVDPDVKISEEGQAKGEYRSPFSLDDWNAYGTNNRDDTGRFERDDGTPITNPVPMGKIKMLVANFLSRLAVKPRTFIYKNQADLKARNPELYARAAAARTQGDFDNVSAVAYSFGGDTVIVFADRVATEQQLNFVLAHEAIGHNGLRSLIGEKQFNALMEQIYKFSPAIQSYVDAAMSVTDQSKAEATEEYLADFAAQLDSSLLARIWNSIKGALNKLGIKFGDETARFFVNQARAYTRNGQTSQFFDAKDVAQRMVSMVHGQDIDGSGRFAMAGDLRRDNLMAGLMMDDAAGIPMSINEAVQRFIDKTGKFSFAADKFVTQFFSLTNFRARENAGLSAINDLLNSGKDLAMNIKVTEKERLGVLLNRAVKLGIGEVGGITTEELDQVNKLLYGGLRYKVATVGDVRKLGKTPLFYVDDKGQLALTVNENGQTEVDRLFELGKLTFAEAKNGYSYDVEYLNDKGEVVKEKVNVPGIKDLTEDSKVWKGYLRARESVKEVEVKLLWARYSSFLQDQDLAFREIADITKPNAEGKYALTAAERQAFQRIYRRYKEFYTADKTYDENGDPMLNSASIEKANDFIVAVNKAIILGEQMDYDRFASFFDDKTVADDAIAFAKDFKQRLVFPEGDEQAKFTIQNRLKDIITFEVANDDADLFTKKSLATGYTPINRKGDHQVRVVVTNAAGRVVNLKQDYKNMLVYSQFEGKDEAVAFARTLNQDLFGDRTYKAEVYDEASGRYTIQEVKLTAMPGAALNSIAAPLELNLNEFVRGLRQFGITLNPVKMENVVVALTKQNARARNRLKREFTPGASSDGVQAIMQHVEARASTIAKVIIRPRLSEIMNRNLRSSNELWNGSKSVLETKRRHWEAMEKNPTATREEKHYAKVDYYRYAFMYNKTNEGGTYEKANQYYNEAAQLLAFLNNNRNVDESDFGSGEVASSVRAYTSVFQLGLSIATGALNYVGAVTNGIPYLATYNSKTAFGGGFGFAKSMAAFGIALNQVGLRKSTMTSLGNIGQDTPGFETAEFYDAVAKDPKLQAKYGLRSHEAKFIADEIREGVMIPAQSNALTATARGRVTSGAGQKLLDGMMWTFNSTEQAVRRGLGLAAYRLAYDRAIAAGRSPAEATTDARAFAVETLKFTLGEYSVMNRPSAWRTGLQSFLYMYKVYPTTTIQLLNRLDRPGKVAMLVSLWLFGGLLAFPFAEDAEDLLDTLAQKLGITGSVRYEVAKYLDQIAPGISPYVMRGVLNSFIPADIASRVSVGNFVPGTGLLLAGSNAAKELEEIGGPSLSMLWGVASTIPNAIRAPFSEKISMVDVLRENPITMGRALGDMLAYDSAGAIIDRRGYVVSKDLTAGTYLTRALGFYPVAAAQQYEFIRTARRMTDYQREISAGYQQAWIKARMSGDSDQVRDINAAVADWNRAAYGTPLYIANFQENAAKAYAEAIRPATQRYLRTAPKASRTDLRSAAEILSY